MALDPTDSMLLEWQNIDAEASVLMKRGMGLAAAAQTSSAVEAIRCFDSAYELRRLLPFESVPQFAYGLAACRLNRGEALMRLPDADPNHVAEAIDAYDQAIELLRKLPLHNDARFPRRLAIGYQNRGLALQTQNPSNLAEISAAFGEAIAVLDHPQSTLIPDRAYLLGTVHLNLANAYVSVLDAKCIAIVQNAARRAIRLVSDLEREDADAAEVGLKARHIFCKSVARDLSEAMTRGEAKLDPVHRATDMVDEGLDLARSWEKKGVVRFRSIANDLFCFGARVYERFQPHFLNEFVIENLDPDHSSADYVMSAEMRRAAEAIFARANRPIELSLTGGFMIRWPRFSD